MYSWGIPEGTETTVSTAETSVFPQQKFVLWGFLKVQEPLQKHLLSPSEMYYWGIPEGREITEYCRNICVPTHKYDMCSCLEES
jgi:hypothetical protein